MKAMIMAAGFGSRLKPFTDLHPKALVPVLGIPALQRQIIRLQNYGFSQIVVNVHHFADQIKDFLAANQWDAHIIVSDESDRILDTGGALLKALPLLGDISKGVLIHNVDIFSNSNPRALMELHRKSSNDITLLTSHRHSSRQLIFDPSGKLRAWHNLTTGDFRPADFSPSPNMRQEAFSGIYVINDHALKALQEFSSRIDSDKFPIMDFLLNHKSQIAVKHHCDPALQLLDVGKPEALARAADFLFD